MELERKKSALVRAVYYALIAGAIFLAVTYLWKLLLPFLLGFFIAYLLRPVVGFISHHSKIGRRGGAIVAAIVFYSLVGLVLWLLWVLILAQLENLSIALPGLYTDTIQPLLQDLNQYTTNLVRRISPIVGMGASQAFESMNAALENVFVSASGWLATGITGMLKSIPMLLLTMVFTILSSVLICVDYHLVVSFVLAQIPQRFHSTLLGIRDFLAITLLKIMKAYLILMIITFAELALGMWLLGVEKFLLLAGVIALLDLLPVLGSGAVLLPWAAWLFLDGKYLTGGGLLILWGLISFVREILEPRIVGDQIGLHPLATLTAMYVGLRLAGLGGIIFAPVICLMVKYLHQTDIIRLYKSPSA